MKRKFSFRLGKLIPSRADETGTEANAQAATNIASSPLIDRGPPLDVKVEAELKSACALIAEGVKPKRERPNDRDRRKLDTTKHTKHHHTKHKDSNRDNEALISSAVADHSQSTSNVEPVVHHVHREANSNSSPPKPRRIIKDQFPELDDSTVADPVDCRNSLHGDAQSRHVSDVPSVSPHADYHQFIRTIGPRSVTDSQRMELDTKPKEVDFRKSFESTGSVNSIISPPVPPPMVEEMPPPQRKKPNKPRLYLEQALIPERSTSNTNLPLNGHDRPRTRDTLPYVEDGSSGMVMRNCDHTFEEVRQERQSITRPMSAQSVRPKREVPHSRSSSAVGWHEPTLNNGFTNRYPTSIYLRSTNDRNHHTNNRSPSPMHDPHPKPVQKIDLNRALPPLPKNEQWEDDVAYLRRSNHRTHIASLMQSENRERITVSKQPTDGQLYLQIMSRIEEIKRAPIDAPPPPKDGVPPPKPIRRPFSALNYHASLREIEYGKRLNERSSRVAKQRRNPEEPQPRARVIRTGLPKALDPAVPPTGHGGPLPANNRAAGIERSGSWRAKTPSRRGSNNRPERSRANPTSTSNVPNNQNQNNNIYKDHPHQNATRGHGNNHVQKSSAKYSYSTTPAKVTIRASRDMTEINNLLKPKVLAELGYTRRINVEKPGTWSTDESYNGSASYVNSSNGGKISSSSNINVSNGNSNSNSNNNNNETRHNHQKHNWQNSSTSTSSNQLMAVKRVLEHVALGGRMRTKTRMNNTKPMSKKERVREERERNKTWMDRIESQGVKAGVMFLDDVAKAPVVRF